MNICMVVCNNLTTDNRVLREAQTLQAAGHQVSVVGIVTGGTDLPLEILPDGVRLVRVDWRASAWRGLLVRAIPWGAVLLLLLGLAVWGAIGVAPPLSHMFFQLPGDIAAGVTSFSRAPWQDKLRIGVICASLGAALAILGTVVIFAPRWSVRRAVAARSRREAMLRSADAGLDASELEGFPPPRSRIPQWVPPQLIESLAVPLAFLGRPFSQFALLQGRARLMAKFCIEQAPDVVHAHDCTALPVAGLVKKALEIPVVYDAHEIYAEAATRRRGVVDYYILLHRKYLPIVNRFITVNQSIAQYYRRVHPDLSPAVVIRNAATRMPDCTYDGRLHEAAGLSRSEKILLYQGGFTPRRGLQELVRSASRLPDGWTLVMMGWGRLEDELRKIALGSDDRRKVIFIPGAPRAEVLQWTAGASLGIIPYEGDVLNHWFCTPNKLWEFPSAGVPLIVQPFPELRKVVEKYGCGWILPASCTPDTLSGMIQALTPEQFRAAREGCRQFIEDDCWEAAYVRPLTELYDSLEPKTKPISRPFALNAQGAAEPARKANSRLAI